MVRNFAVDQDRYETNLLQRFAQQENSKWFSIISFIIFEVNVVAEQKQTLTTSFLFFIIFHCPQLFIAPPALLLFRRTYLPLKYALQRNRETRGGTFT